jgi:hypothetical protein
VALAVDPRSSIVGCGVQSAQAGTRPGNWEVTVTRHVEMAEQQLHGANDMMRTYWCRLNSGHNMRSIIGVRYGTLLS